MKTTLLLILTLLAFLSPALSGPCLAQDAIPIPYLTIKPTEYHNKRITVSGYVYLTVFDRCISAYEPSESNFIFKNSVQLDIMLAQISDYAMEEVHFNFCTVSGVFDTSIRGNSGQYPGTLHVESIQCQEREPPVTPN
ncbi:MAG: hypothetical protein D6E12_12300 [Desulfovibrio sp.]|nr:MAG: hypothetical protein D6E12_12300 [Desulfovibrio sp.]